MSHLRQIELFAAVAETGSVSRAAERLELSISAASRYLQALEARLGVRLIERTTRRLFLTEAGHEFLKRARTALTEIREAEASIRDFVIQPSGILRVTASLSFCLLHIEPLLPSFMAAYPGITLDVIAANRYHDIIENGIDLAIRTREFEADSSLTIRKLAQTRRILAATPAYLAKYGMPTHPRDLASHKMLVYKHAASPNELSFTCEGERETVTLKPFISANDGQIVVQSALNDMGILIQPKYIVMDHLRSGKLLPVLDPWHLPRLTMNLAFQTRSHMPAKTRLFIDYLIDHFNRNRYTSLWSQ